MSSGPNPFSVGISVVRSLISVRRPGPFGTATTDHSLLSLPLRRLRDQGPDLVAELEDELRTYLDHVSIQSPNSLSRNQALAYWINLYNSGALLLAGQAQRAGVDSVLGVPGGFSQRMVTVDDENLSLDDIEHAKLRRFGDPRIHAALICGSVSCPTLRSEPYSGESLDGQLDDQIRYFLGAGALQIDEDHRVVYLSRIFLWFGGDFTRPQQMPTFIPARGRRVLEAIRPWLEPTTGRWVDDADPTIEYQRYDWGLRCVVS